MIEAAKKLKVKYHVGITASTDTFNLGQGRPGFNNYLPSHKTKIFEDMQKANVKNFRDGSRMPINSGIYLRSSGRGRFA